MQVSPAAQSAAKPSRAKAKSITTEPKDGAKKTRTRRKAALAVEEGTPVDAITPHPTPEEMLEMIATAAYFIAAERHFAGGHELDDWLTAERSVREQFPG